MNPLQALSAVYQITALNSTTNSAWPPSSSVCILAVLPSNHYLPPKKEEVNAFVHVCLLARLLKNVCMDLDETLRVDRCQDMDKLINF